MTRSLRLALAAALGAMALPLAAGATAGAATPPRCVVSLSPTATDTLFAIGAGHQVQAVDESSNYPAAAKALSKKHVINALSPSVESLLGICATSSSHPSTKPDLVVLTYNPSDLEQKLTAQGVKVVDLEAPSSVAGALAQIRELGRLTGHVARADALAASMKARIAAAVASVPAHPHRTIAVYYEVSYDPYYSLTSATFVGSILRQIGLTNIADAAPSSGDNGYPELQLGVHRQRGPRPHLPRRRHRRRERGEAAGLRHDVRGQEPRRRRAQRRRGVPVGSPLRHPRHPRRGGRAPRPRPASRAPGLMSERTRCAWVSDDEDYRRYHDEEWGVPEHDERRLFELLTLEGAQAGLSWLTVLRRRDGYRRAFSGFDPAVVAGYNDARIASIMEDPGVVRHSAKVASAVTNARAILALGERGTTFEDLAWSLARAPGDAPAVAAAMSKQLRRDGFTFVGPTICRSFMQAGGMVNDHERGCFRFAEVAALASGRR